VADVQVSRKKKINPAMGKARHCFSGTAHQYVCLVMLRQVERMMRYNNFVDVISQMAYPFLYSGHLGFVNAPTFYC